MVQKRYSKASILKDACMSLTILDTMPDLLMVVWERTRRMPSWLFSKTPKHILTSQLTEKLETRLKRPLHFPRLGLSDA